MGARGNSGVILSQLLRGLVEKFKPDHARSATELLAAVLEHADVLARQAVVRPIEGTILSIARAGAEGARQRAGLRSRRWCAAPATARVTRSPSRPSNLPSSNKPASLIRRAAAGLLLWFDALCHVVVGRSRLPEPPALDSIVLTCTNSPVTTVWATSPICATK
jgi:hypothetical protein